jgi:hypothetical protein
MKRYLSLLLALLGILAFPHCARADAGTPLMWAGRFHLLFGNALIGVGEACLLGWLFGLPKRRSVAIMIPANYFSAWIGLLFIRGAMDRAPSLDLSNGWRWFWIMVVVTYGMTLVLEWPFIALCCRGKKDWLRRSLWALLVVVSASYIALFGWYWIASGTSLYTEMKIVAPADLTLPKSVLVYFIASEDGNVYQRQVTGGNAQSVYALHSTSRDDRLFVRPNATDKTHWDLVACLDTGDWRNPRMVDVLKNLAVEAAPDWLSSVEDPRHVGTDMNVGPVSKLGSATGSSWGFTAYQWPWAGLRGSNQATGEFVRFSYETPFGEWAVRNAVHLPSDKILFQLGDDQVCAFDPVTRRVALLWHGRGPVAVIEKPGAEPGGPANVARPRPRGDKSK